MTDTGVARLPDRGLIQVTGPEAAKFLQDLVTNDIAHAPQGTAIFAGLLTPQGKILFDFLIYRENEDSFLIDCSGKQTGDLVMRLSLYKLRAKIAIADRSAEFCVGTAWGDYVRASVSGLYAVFADPRYGPLGDRLFLRRDDTGPDLLKPFPADEAAYHSHRISLAVPQGGLDYTYGETFPHDACYDELHGVDFRKGCYVGQEIVSRMHHKGIAKTRIAVVEAASEIREPNAVILAGDKPVGRLGSADGTHGIAMVRLDRIEEAARQGLGLTIGNIDVTVRQPPWASYRLPSSDVRS